MTDMTAAFVKVGEQAARIAELEAQLARVTARCESLTRQRDQCAEAVSQLVSQLGPVAKDAHELAAVEDGRAALASVRSEGGAL